MIRVCLEMVLSFQLQKRKWMILTQPYLHQKATLKFFTRCLFFIYRHLILIISYSMCVIIVCLRKLQDVVEAIRTNILRVFNKKLKKSRRDLWNAQEFHVQCNGKSYFFFLFNLLYYLCWQCQQSRDTRLLLTIRGNEIAMENTTQRISQTITVSLWNVSYMKDAGHIHATRLCILRRHAYVINIFLIMCALLYVM